jgi:hypothetical protein
LAELPSRLNPGLAIGSPGLRTLGDVSLVPPLIFSGSGLILAGIVFYMRTRDERWARATPFLMSLAILCVGLAVLVTLPSLLS